MTHLLVLAGGFGTRLRSIVTDVPKPLAPVAGRPYLSYMLESWLQQGVTSFIFLLHYQAKLVEAFLENEKTSSYWRPCQVQILTELQPLGTGGAVAYAINQFNLKKSFLVTNADTWLGSGIQQLLTAKIPAIAVVTVENTQRYGTVCTEGNKIINFVEKQACHGEGLINAGLYHLHPDLFADWYGKAFSLERELFPALVAARKLIAVPLLTDFVDIGEPNDYVRFCRWIESKKIGPL